MKPIHYILIALSVIIIFLSIKYWEDIMDFLGFTKKEPSQSAYEKCIAVNKSLEDGADCTNCIPDGSQKETFNGKIINGECKKIVVIQKADIETTQATKNYLIVSKQGGAHPYIIQGNNQLASLRMVVPYGTKLEYGRVITSPRMMYQTKYGYLDAVDVSMPKPNQD